MSRYKGKASAKTVAATSHTWWKCLYRPADSANGWMQCITAHCARHQESRRAPDRREVIAHDAEFFIRW